MMAETLSAYHSSSRALISFECWSEISQERKALCRKSVEAIEIFDVGKLVTWKIWKRIGGAAFVWGWR